MQVANTRSLHTSVTANLNSYIANTNPRITNILTSVGSTNTALRTLIDDRMQVANVVPTINSHLQGGTGVDYYSNGMISIGQEVYTNSDVTFSTVTSNSIVLTGGTDASAGTLEWNIDEGTVDITLENGVVLQTGQEEHFYGKATEAISDGEIVMFAGAQGGHVLLSVADQDSAGFVPEFVVGVATQDFDINDFGYVTTLGKVRGIDTSSFNEGDILYFDPDNAGAFTTTKPAPPDHIIQIAAVLRSHQNQGTILVRPQHMADTDETVEGNTNLYYTDARVASYLSTNGYDTATNIISTITDSAPATLDTLNELAAALGDDANFATTVTTNLGQKLGATASVTLTGDATGSGSFSSNSLSISVTVDDSFASNANLQTEVTRINLLNTNLTGTNTALRTLISGNENQLNSYVANTEPRISSLESTTTSNSYISATYTTNSAFQSALANTNAYIASVAVSAGEVSNAYLTSTFTTNTTFQAALANTNLAIADRIQVANLNTTLADYWPSANIITHVSTEVAALVNSAPSTLDTLNKLADALGDDPNFATTLTTNLSQKLGSTATVTLTGDATGSASFSANAVSVAVSVSDDFASNTYFQAYVSNTNPRLTTLETAGYITSSDTTQYLQVANVAGYIPANTSTTSAALSGNTVTFTRADSTTFDVDLTPIVGVGGGGSSVANTENISNQVFKTKQTGANTRTFMVTVGTKTANSPFQGGSASAYFIDGEEVPGLTLVPGFTYRFDQSDSTNNSHLIKFWRDANKTTAYTTGISDTGSAGTSGAYTDFTVTANTPMTLFYQCTNHSYMGGQIAVLSDTSPKYVEVSNLDIYWPSANVIQALNDFQPSLTLSSFSVNTLAANGGGSLAYNDQTGTFAFKPADLSNLSGGGTSTVVSNTAPALSGNGALWFDEDDATLYIENDGVFVDAVGSTPNNFISYSGNNTLRLITTAGEFIDADLSSIGGGGGVSGTDEDLTGTARTYTANGTATTFAASYSRANPEDVFVSVDGLDQRPTTDYTINGANVTFGTAPDSGSTVMIRTFNGLLGTNTASFDLNSYTANGTATDFFSPSSQATLEDLLITVNGVVQRPTTDYTLSAQTVSFGTAPVNSSTVAIRSIRSRISQVTEAVTYSFANNTTIDAGIVDQDIKISTYTANGTETSFAANTSTITLDKSIVAINGILQRPTTDYTLNSGDVVFGTAPANNDIVSIREFNTAGQVINTNVKTWAQVHSNQTLEINKSYFVDTTNTAITVTLPLGKSMGDEVRIIDAVGKSSNNNITVNGNGTKIMGSSSDMTVSTNRAAFSLVYYNATQGWLLMEV